MLPSVKGLRDLNRSSEKNSLVYGGPAVSQALNAKRPPVQGGLDDISSGLACVLTRSTGPALPELEGDDYIPPYVCGGNRSINHYLPPLFTTTPETTKKQSDGSAFRLKGSLDC